MIERGSTKWTTMKTGREHEGRGRRQPRVRTILRRLVRASLHQVGITNS